MFSTEFQRNEKEDFVTEQVTTDAQTAEIYGHLPYRVLVVSLADGQIVNDGTDSVTVTVEIVDGLEIARGTDRIDATILDYDGTATLKIDGTEHSVTISGGTGTLDYATTQTAPATVEVQATALDAKPAEASETVTIEVTQA